MAARTYGDQTIFQTNWFQDNDVPAYEDDGSIYVQAGRDADVQISTSEIDYRADLQTDYEREKQSLNN